MVPYAITSEESYADALVVVYEAAYGSVYVVADGIAQLDPFAIAYEGLNHRVFCPLSALMD